jgi:hypothetical protein
MLIRMIAWLAGTKGLETLFVAVRSHLPGVGLTDEVAKTPLVTILTENWLVWRGINKDSNGEKVSASRVK